MNDFYIASYDLSGEDYLQHYGRKGMKWYQHIFGKEPNGRYTAKKRAKMVKKYGPQKTRLKEAQSVRNAYRNAQIENIHNKDHEMDKKDRAEYQNAINKIVDEGTWDLDMIVKIGNMRKKEHELAKQQEEADKKANDYWIETNKYEQGEKELPASYYRMTDEGKKDFWRKRSKELDKLIEKSEELSSEYYDTFTKRMEATAEWTNQLFGTNPTKNSSYKEMEDTGMAFITSLPQSFYDEYESLYNAAIKVAEEKRKQYK